jgi:ribosomal protein L32
MVDGHCQCTVCPRCGHHTGNAHQGHYWSLCQVTGTERRPHFCCPDNCEIEAL